MILHSFSLYDRKASAFMTPFFMGSRGLAIRALTDLVADMTTAVGRHPQDFALFQLAEWDDHTGRFADQIPEFVCDAESCVRNWDRDGMAEAAQ